MRIIAGEWRRRQLRAPPGEATRPSADRTRETLFAMLTSRLGSFEGLRVADLFAGSGALGLEALSRGAASCLFVEQDAAAIRALRANIAALRAQPQCEVRASSVMQLGPAAAPLDRLHRLGWIGAVSWIAVETAHDEKVQVKALDVEAERKVGKALLTLVRLPSQG